ncbi:hypothetical protein GGF44_000816 [Coemansia sp. RSA 1694]|nr:hypothetical protein GGF38_000914 [Coemansia sp. RSA 25]KAJ2644100.1 hypothetical protein GGF44_000816 [Coemansia sp. RSA 1694]
MLALSAFQLLPPHVMKMIVDHVAGYSHLRYDRIYKDSDEYKLLQMPLLWVCHNFCAFAHARFCSKYELKLEEDRDSYADSRRSWSTYIRRIDYPTHHLAKKLHISLGLWSVFSGKAIQQLSGAPYEGCAFPLVRQLTIDIRIDIEYRRDFWNYPPDGLDAYPLETTANIAAFVQRVKQMVLDVREIHLSLHYDVQRLLEGRRAHIVDLTQQLYGIVETTTVITRASRELVEHMDLESIRKLVSVDYSFYSASSPIMLLLRRSAQTLQSLDLSKSAHLDYTELIRDPVSGGTWVEYPRLHTVKLSAKHDTGMRQNSISNDAVLFPRLRRLVIYDTCPFDDDVLFRGNATILEFLSIDLSSEMVAILKRHNVFTPTSHPKLQCVHANDFTSYAPSAFATAAEYLEFVLSIAPRASVRMIDNLYKFEEKLTQGLEALGNHDSIQILSLNHTTLLFWDVVNLIRSLLLLSDLLSRSTYLGTFPQGATYDELPEYVRSTYAPMGKRFRCWNISYVWAESCNGMATCILLLALVCPIFNYAPILNAVCHQELRDAVKRQIAEPRFFQYAPRLRRLLSN